MIDTSSRITEAAAGDAEALEQIYRRFEPLVRQTARRATDCEDDAEDVVQEVFLTLPNALDRYEEQGRFDAWIARLTMRTALMRRRAKLRADARFDDTTPRSTPAHDEAILSRLALADALTALPDHARELVRLRQIEGLSHDEVAAQLGISRNASEVRLHRALKQLRTLLSESR